MKTYSDLELHMNCPGCDKVIEDLCSMYLEPKKQWTRIGGCSGRSHMKECKVEEVKYVNPLKQSKRSMGK